MHLQMYTCTEIMQTS